MPKRSVPRYCLHKATGQARIRIDGKDCYLGKFGSPESHLKYAAIISDWQAQQEAPPTTLTVAELSLLYMEHCKQHYTKNGEPTSEVNVVRLVLRFVNLLRRAKQV